MKREAPDKIENVLTRADVCRATGISATTLWRLVRARAFPQPLRLSANRIGFRAATVSAWIANREAAAADPALPPPKSDTAMRSVRHVRRSGRRR
ncbi:MAG: helix-turn-helix transcriptional regulator [Hyphomicrobiaceae bacterium]